MGDLNQVDFVRKHRERFEGPFLEVGSKDYGTTPNLRPLFPESEYVGVDMEPGPGVDLVLDLTQDFEKLHRALAGRRFGTVFCLSVLEHCRDPFAMCRNITRLLLPSGMVYVSVPFAWELHGYPSDYWRFTPEAIKVLFPELEFPAELSNLHTAIDGDVRPVDTDLGSILISTRKAIREKRYGRILLIGLFRALKQLGIATWIFRYRYLLPPVMIDMLGVRKPAPGAA